MGRTNQLNYEGLNEYSCRENDLETLNKHAE